MNLYFRACYLFITLFPKRARVRAKPVGIYYSRDLKPNKNKRIVVFVRLLACICVYKGKSTRIKYVGDTLCPFNNRYQQFTKC